MYIDRNTDTIFAPATVPGTGAITIIRISGPDAIKAAAMIVHSPEEKANPDSIGHRQDISSGRYGGNNAIAASKGYRIHFGQIHGSDGRILDEVLVSVFRAPHSYTGEDSVEISCHASSYIAGELSALLVREGLRPAEPGEFTQRAFLNGKMDLAQAEAVADVIASGNAAAHRVAFSQLKGGFSSELKSMRGNLLEIASLMELELDFSDEDVEFADRDRLSALVDKVLVHIRRLMESFRLGNAIKDGIPVAIVGATNVGKSTLLNALLGEDRAIVSDIHGTTRDTIEETMNVDGILFRFIDTAGLRDTDEEVEKIGIERSYRKLHDARIVLGIVDASRTEAELMKEVSDIIGNTDTSRQKVFIVINKCDLAEMQASGKAPAGTSGHISSVDYTGESNCAMRTAHFRMSAGHSREPLATFSSRGLERPRHPDHSSQPLSRGEELRTSISYNAGTGDGNGYAMETGEDIAPMNGNEHGDKNDNKNVIDLNKIVSYIANKEVNLIGISAKEKTGIEELKSALASSQKDIIGAADTVLVTNIRHFEALSSAYAALERVRSGLSAGIPTDLVAQDLREALHHLGSILGEISTPEILASVFSRFCVGK